MEFCDRSLEKVLQNANETKRPIQMALIKQYMRQIFIGLQAMHAKNISHRDLKPENILLVSKNGQEEIKICDLGAAKVLTSVCGKDGPLNTPYVVSRYYRAPELIMGSNKYDCSIDIWSVGCMLFELITRTPLFPGEAEGLQILEQSMILGTPEDHEVRKLDEMVVKPVMALLKRFKDNGKVEMTSLLEKA